MHFIDFLFTILLLPPPHSDSASFFFYLTPIFFLILSFLEVRSFGLLNLSNINWLKEIWLVIGFKQLVGRQII